MKINKVSKFKNTRNQLLLSTRLFHFTSYAKLLEKEPIFTKRGISCLIPSIFDVHGFISPYILIGNMILSRVWAYEKSEPSPEPAYTNNDEKSHETPSPDTQHFSSSDIEFETNKTLKTMKMTKMTLMKMDRQTLRVYITSTR